MDILYAPWREKYATDTAHGPKGQNGVDEKECVFCIQLAHNTDEAYFILARYKHNFIMFNRYPYNSGHLLIIPLEHKANLEDFSFETHKEHIQLINQTTQILKRELKTDGFNIGINLGKAAGAGLPSHMHTHVLPRWQGDTNFLPTIGNVKQIPTDLVKLYATLRPKFQNLPIL